MQVRTIDQHTKQKEADRKKQLQIASRINNKRLEHKFCKSNLDKKISAENEVASKSNVLVSNFTKSNATKTTVVNSCKIETKTNNENNVKPKVIKKKPSFSEILELAKNNVQNCDIKKRPFDDLIPCPLNSKFRQLDKKVSDVKIQLPKGLSEMGDCSSFKFEKPNNLKVHVSNDKLKYNISRNVNQGLTSNLTTKGVLQKKKFSTIVDKRNSCNLKKNDVEPDNKLKNQPLSFSSKVPKEQKNIVSEKLDNIKKMKDKKVFSTNSDISHSKISHLENRVPLRGIAAQFGIGFRQNNLSFRSDYDDDDDYASDDSFIDDSEVIKSSDYARMVCDIHKSLHFDPRKYQHVNPYDNLNSMESGFTQIEKEQQRRYVLFS